MAAGRVPGISPASFSSASLLAPRGMAAAGLSSDSFVFFDDFGWGGIPLFGWTQALGGTGTISTGAAFKHTSRAQTGGTAASSVQVRQNSGGNCVITSSTDPWYHASRMKLVTAVTAQTTAWSGWFKEDLTNTLGIGFFGGLNSSFFGVQHSPSGVETGTFLSLAVAPDTNFHLFEMWSNGDGKIYARIDSGVVVSATQSITATNQCMTAQIIRNGTDAVNRAIDIDYVMFMANRS